MNEDAPYFLKAIMDAGSPLKSDIAKYLVRGLIGEDIIINERNDDCVSNCQNNVEECLPPGREKCGVKIADNFLLIDEKDSSQIIIGNHCIARFVEKGLISNVSMERLAEIRKLLSIKNVCISCWKLSKAIIHNKCSKIKENLHLELECVVLAKGLENVMHQVVGLQNIYAKLYPRSNLGCQKPFTKRDLETLREASETYSILYNNQEKIEQLKNNPILSSIMFQKRYPSTKQLAIVEKIMKDFDAMLELDSSGSAEYLKYGYVYPRKRR